MFADHLVILDTQRHKAVPLFLFFLTLLFAYILFKHITSDRVMSMKLDKLRILASLSHKHVPDIITLDTQMDLVCYVWHCLSLKMLELLITDPTVFSP